MKKKILVSTLIMMIFFTTCTVIYGMTHYEKVNFVTGMVMASALNVRSGPGTNFKSVGLVYKNEYVRVFAKVGDWYVIQTESDLVGAVNKNYIKAITGNSNSSSNSNSSNTGTTNKSNTGNTGNTVTTTATSEEEELLKLINEQRAAYGLSALKMDAELQRVAKIKAQDLVDNNYFSHNSPTYGSPFDMMKSFGITYKAAGENIAGNSTLKGAVTAWMNSQGHRENILSNAYNYTGIGIVESKTYGKILVQMFIGK